MLPKGYQVDKAQQILETKPKEEVAQIQKAIPEVEKLRDKYEEAWAKHLSEDPAEHAPELQEAFSENQLISGGCWLPGQ